MTTTRFLSFAVFTLSALLAPRAVASDMGQVAASMVSKASYRHFLDDMLYTHDGDNRGYGPEHDLAQANIVSLMTSFGLDVALEPVSYGGNTYYNVVGTKLGVVDPSVEYVIGAHYDSVNNPGADDNASGTALVLEAARVLSAYPSDYTIRFIAFDREEQGLIGSETYVLEHLEDDIVGMISADMVAYNRGTNSVDINGRSTSNTVKYGLADAVTTYGRGLSVYVGGKVDASDHAPFEWYGFQACLIIEDWGNPNYHTQRDSVDTAGYIDYAYATRVTRSVVGHLADVAGVTTDLPDGDFNDDGAVDAADFAQFEACFTGPVDWLNDPSCVPGDLATDAHMDCTDWDLFTQAWTDPSEPPTLAACSAQPPLPAPAPFNRLTNRYVSFAPPDSYLSMAFEVEITDNMSFPGSTGIIGWVGEPEADGLALVVDAPYYSDTWPDAIHVGDCETVPAASYAIRSILEGEDPGDPLNYSEPVIVQTTAAPGNGIYWGDCVGSFGYFCDESWQCCGPNPDCPEAACPGSEICVQQWLPPDGATNFQDVQAAIRKFQEVGTTPHITAVDLHGAEGSSGDAYYDPPNAIANFADVQQIILAFQGEPYPYCDPMACP